MIEPPLRKSGSAFCTVKSSPFTFMSKVLSKCSSVIEPNGHEFAAASVGEDNVDVTFFPLDRRVQAIEVPELRDVTLNCGDVLGDQLDGLVELPLAAGL